MSNGFALYRILEGAISPDNKIKGSLKGIPLWKWSCQMEEKRHYSQAGALKVITFRKYANCVDVI